jgi:asparagine synthase (glutamine-hydrolysing)
VTFCSHSDTEVILAAYRVWGTNCFLRLAGMFALGLWDAHQQRLILARDPMGIKPLYYFKSERTFLFASEVRTLLQTGVVPRQVDPNGALSYLAFGSVYEPWTIVEGISAIPPGYVVSLENGDIHSYQYWNPLDALRQSVQAQGENGSSPGRCLPEVLHDAVLSHLVSDVPVGVFLSGGIDSSALVAVMSQAGVRASTFSLVFREEEFNEAAHSREVARRFGTDHQEILVSEQDALATLPEALSAMDQPTMDGINTWLVSAKTRAAGVKVALTGLGADEMFAGYSNFHRVPRMERLAARFDRLPSQVRRPVAASVALFAGKSDRNRKLSELASGNNPTVHPYFLARALFTPEERRSLFAADYETAARGMEKQLRNSVEAARNIDPVNRVSYLESHWYMTNTLLRDSDFMSMAHGLELRVPFLDRTLVEACLRIPGAEKVKGPSPKNLLLSSLGVELPMEIVKRPKRGFTLPFEKWLRGEMKPTVENVLMGADHCTAPLNDAAVQQTWKKFLAGETSWSRPWSLFVLKRWCEKNLQGTS